MQPTQNALLAWLSENWLRITSKSPKFFKVWQIISAIIVAVTGLPGFLTMFDIHLPLPWTNTVNIAVAWAARGALFISLLPTKPVPVGTDDRGKIVKVNNEKKLPFTTNQEKQELLKDAVK